MVEVSRIAPIPRTFLNEAPSATFNVGLALISRRSTALADFWRSCAEVRLPTELVALQLNYWTQMVDDYQEALNEGLSQLTSEPAAAAKAKPARRSA